MYVIHEFAEKLAHGSITADAAGQYVNMKGLIASRSTLGIPFGVSPAFGVSKRPQASARAQIDEAQRMDDVPVVVTEAGPVGGEPVGDEAMFVSLEMKCLPYERTRLTDILNW